MRAHRIAQSSISRFARASAKVCQCSLWAGFAACGFDPPAGGGLTLEARESSYEFASSPSTAVDAGFSQEEAGAMPSEDGCKHVSAFTEHVTPRFSATCTECHDGTKIKALFRLNLLYVDDLSAEAQEMTCDLTLATTNLEAPEESTILTFVDPSNAETVHDFKFETVEEYTAYRSAVLTWLQLELEAR